MSQIAARRLLATLPRAERIIRVSANSLTVREGASATLRVRLSERPRVGQTVTVTAESNDTSEATVSPASRTFTNSTWNDWQDFTVAGAQDADGNDENTSIVLAATGGGYDDTAAVAVTVEDDEIKRLRLSDATLTVGGTVTSRTIGVRLGTRPTGDVDVAASVTGSLVSVSPTSRTFTQATWNDQQIFTINLDDTSGSGSSTLALDPSGADYAAVATVNVPIAIEASIPGEVTNVRATTRKHERLTIGWNAASLATSYNFRFRKSTSANWTNRTGLSATQQIERELDPSATYDVQVQGVNAAGTGPWSTLVQVATLTGNKQTIQFPAEAVMAGYDASDRRQVLTIGPGFHALNSAFAPSGERYISEMFLSNRAGRVDTPASNRVLFTLATTSQAANVPADLATAFETSGTLDLRLSSGETLFLRQSDTSDRATPYSWLDQHVDAASLAAFRGAVTFASSHTVNFPAWTLVIRDYDPSA